MPPDARQSLVRKFAAKQRISGNIPGSQRQPKGSKAFKIRSIQEDDPKGRWNPGLQGNQRWGPSYRGAANYSKGRGKAD